MGRKLFLRHLAEAATAPPLNISHVQNVDEGVVAFQFDHVKEGLHRDCSIRLLAMDIDEYPDGNTYMIYTEDERIDPQIPQAFEILSPLLFGRSIKEALQEISTGLTDALTRGEHHNPIDIDDQSQELDADDFIEDDEYDDDIFGLEDQVPKLPSARIASITRSSTPGSSTVPTHKIRSDLRAVKEAGYRLGVIGDLTTGGIICVSIRVSKLGISEEAMQAWGLHRRHYIVLLIRFHLGYRDLEQVKEDSTLAGRTEMRVALCQRYKPTSNDAFAAFNQVDQKANDSSHSKCPLEPLFIGRPLNDLLRERFTKIVSFRESCAFNWPSSEAFVNDIQGKALSAIHVDINSWNTPDDASSKALPAIVTADAMDGKLVKDASLPLVAMQFVLRHFVRCTEFCLVCHCKIGDTFEALKPYVCSRPLCLYQYMALGFGPSIEWELISQPYVVDLLISFCYSAAKQGRLKDFPVGIDLRVPFLPNYNDQFQNYRPHSTKPAATTSMTTPSLKTPVPDFWARLDFSNGQLLCDQQQQQAATSLRTGDWIVIHSKDSDEDLHYRVEETLFPTISLSTPLQVEDIASAVTTGQAYLPPKTPVLTPVRNPLRTRPATPPKVLPIGLGAVDCFCYRQSFDELPPNGMHHAIVTLLNTLPPVLDMQKYLEDEQKGKDPSLKTWRSRISDPALNLLRWIIASNRSCIMQVDKLVRDKESTKTIKATDDRVAGMDDWMQFRFAQGAPDKEQRFVDCVKKETEAADKKYPTIFAWHGSPIANWHSIIRQGLRFDEIHHGRAYGNGVYMSNIASTSVGYSSMYNSGDPLGKGWPHSILKISSAFSLNEVVNVPERFVSRAPHYVVADVDWIQTRYLFVKSDLDHSVGGKPAIEYEQDPAMRASNDRGQAIQIPITAVSKSRRPTESQKATKNGDKKMKQVSTTDQATAERQEDDANSILSDDEDRALLESDFDEFDEMSIDDDFLETSESKPAQLPLLSRKRGLDASQTDFVPASLDVSSIRFLDPPSDASTTATKALMGWFKEALKVQDSTPLDKLGWYINPEHMNNMYQWIVELHSFDSKLPLASDMKNAGLKSIVIEMRFTNQFPFSPPFIRVVKPRFLPFNQGGGGHVTEGGAICMELLTNSGWSAVTTLEGVLMQVRLAMSEEERPAKLLDRGKGTRYYGGSRGDSYAVGEAIVAYERACRAHGWKVPEGFNKFNQDDSSGPGLGF